MAAAAARAYVDFVPSHSLLEEPNKVVLRVDLSAEGFRKEQLRVQIDNIGRLRISGERPLRADSNRWRRFGKDFHVPEGCDASAIRARLEKGGVLLITMPRLSPAPAEDLKATSSNTGGVARQDKQKDHASSQQEAAAAAAAAAAEAEEEERKEEGAGAASMERPDQHDQRTSNDAGAAASAGRPAYGFATKRRRTVWAILAVVLTLVGAGLYASYRLMDPSAETSPAGKQIALLSDS